MVTPDFIATRKGVTFTTAEEAQLRALISDSTELIIDYLDDCFDTDDSYTAGTISFDGEIQDSVSGFTFLIDQWIRVEKGEENAVNETGSQYNGGYYFLDAVSTSTLTTYPETNIEAAGRSITITAQFFPQGLKGVFADLIYYDFQEKSNLKSENIGTYSYTMIDIGGVSYPESIAGRLKVYKRPKFR